MHGRSDTKKGKMEQRCQPALDVSLLCDVYRFAHACKVHRIPSLLAAYLGEHELCRDMDRLEAFRQAERDLRAAMFAVKVGSLTAVDMVASG